MLHRVQVLSIVFSLLLGLIMTTSADCAGVDLDVALHFPDRQKWTWVASAQSVLEYYGIDESQCNLSGCCGSWSYECSIERPYSDISNLLSQRHLDAIPLWYHEEYNPFTEENYTVNGYISWYESVDSIQGGRPFIMGFDYFEDLDSDPIDTSYAVAYGYEQYSGAIDYLDPHATGAVRSAYWWLTSDPWLYVAGMYAQRSWRSTIEVLDNPKPDCETMGASVNSSSTARITGIVNANTRSATANFQFGTYSDLSFSTETQTTVINGAFDKDIWSELSGLRPSTTYYYRVKAVSNGGTCLGSIKSFSTAGMPAACGSANGNSFDTKPTTGLCNGGNPSSVSGTGPWSWTCSNSSGSDTKICSADINKYRFNIWILSGSGTVTSSPGIISWPYNVSGTTDLYNYGTVVTFTANPSPGYEFTGWGLETIGIEGTTSACNGNAETCTVVVTKYDDVWVEFTELQTLTIQKPGAGKGTVKSTSPSSPVIDCGSTCSNSYAQNTIITLTAIPAPGSIFTGWSGACTGKGTCSVTMTSAQSVTATFVPDITPILMLLLED